MPPANQRTETPACWESAWESTLHSETWVALQEAVHSESIRQLALATLHAESDQ